MIQKLQFQLSGVSVVALSFWALLLVLMSGCGEVAPGEEATVGALDHNVFKASVQPILDNRTCSNSACHYRDKNAPNSGGPGGGLRLYECTVAPCTDEQLQANHDSSAGLSNLVNPNDSRLLKKPLSVPAGGISHSGGDIFSGTTDADFNVVLGWIQSPL